MKNNNNNSIELYNEEKEMEEQDMLWYLYFDILNNTMCESKGENHDKRYIEISKSEHLEELYNRGWEGIEKYDNIYSYDNTLFNQYKDNFLIGFSISLGLFFVCNWNDIDSVANDLMVLYPIDEYHDHDKDNSFYAMIYCNYQEAYYDCLIFNEGILNNIEYLCNHQK